MADIVDAATRSRMMSSIRGRNTRPEVVLRKALHRKGFRYRLHRKGLPGRPDIVMPRYRAVVFVHGCFWHRHEGCRYATDPATRPDFWSAKFDSNVQRDRRNAEMLRLQGWRVATVWECSLRGSAARATADRLEEWIKSDAPCASFA